MANASEMKHSARRCTLLNQCISPLRSVPAPAHTPALAPRASLKIAFNPDARYAHKMFATEYQRQLPAPMAERCFPQKILEAAARPIAIRTQAFPSLTQTDRDG